MMKAEEKKGSPRYQYMYKMIIDGKMMTIKSYVNVNIPGIREYLRRNIIGRMISTCDIQQVLFYRLPKVP